MKGFRNCSECGSSFSLSFRSTNSKFCGEDCKIKVRRAVQKRDRDKRKERSKHDLDFCSNETFKKYKQRSPSRGLEFSLTSKDFRDRIDSPCYYCAEDYQGIGLDRIENDIGYHLTNIVPCCPTCNRMKNTTGLVDFIDKCKKIAFNSSMLPHTL